MLTTDIFAKYVYTNELKKELLFRFPSKTTKKAANIFEKVFLLLIQKRPGFFIIFYCYIYPPDSQENDAKALYIGQIP